MTVAGAERPGADARFGHVQSVWRALDLLEALAGEEPVGLVDLAGRAGLQPSTARRLLATMAARGYVVQSRRSGGYLIGHRALSLRGPVQRRTARLRRVARPHLERARRVSGETISLVVPVESTSVLWIDEVAGAPPATARLGRCLPARATAAGRALLAEPRDGGFAIEDEELEPGVVAVAAAVATDRGPIAAIGVSGPAARLRAIGLDELGEMASIFAGELAADLGRTEPRPLAA
jgi:DNA-binding IclR family transcriptional regulator